MKRVYRNHDLPVEIIEDILIKLPVKSIARFRCVSKPWLHLITSRSFIFKHLIKTEEESSIAICFHLEDTFRLDQGFIAICLYDDAHKQIDDDDDDDRKHIDDDDDDRKGMNKLMNICYSRGKQAPNYPTTPVLNFELPFSYRAYHCLAGNCHGILCLTDDRHTTIVLANPSLNEMKLLPVSPFGNVPEINKLVGIGFDDITMNYKVVRILTTLDQTWKAGKKANRQQRAEIRSRAANGQQQRAEVYDLTSNAWRQLNDCPFVVDHAIQHFTFFNGVIHWCTKTSIGRWRMLTFNTTTELFQQTKFPEDWYNNLFDDTFPGLFVLNQESLAFVSYGNVYWISDENMNIWKRNKDGIDETWIKLYSIGSLTRLEKPISFWKKDKLLYKTMENKLISYDLSNHRSSVVCDWVPELIQLNNKDWRQTCVGIDVCRSSLVSINI